MTTNYIDKENALLDQYYKTGDLAILGALYEPYMHLIYGVCLNYLKDTGKSEDAVMQIFESLVKKLRIHKVTNFKSWLYTVARNHCLMILRKDQKNIVTLSEETMEFSTNLHLVDNTDGKEEQLQIMEKCIEKLNPEQQSSIRLFFLEQKCYQEIANLTGYELKKVKSYIQNGKRNLKICMEQHQKSNE